MSYAQKTLFLCIVGSTLLSLVLGLAIQDDRKKERAGETNIIVGEEPATEKQIKFPWYHSGYDYDDRPVIVMEWGKYDIRGLAEQGGEEVVKFEKGVDKFLELIKTGFLNKRSNDSTESSESDNMVVGIVDFEGLNLRQIATPASMSLFVRNLGKLERVYEQFAYAFLVNSNPLVNQVINLAKPYMGKFLERSEVYGTISRRWIPKVLRKIPRSQLHPVYGGTKDFRPVGIYNLF